jgi:hypothetical protein
MSYRSSTINISGGSPGSFTTLTVGGVASITANSASAALTVTQTGAGNAFVVEDSASPDSTPFAINAAGEVGIQVPAKAGTQIRLPVGADVRVAVSTDTPHLAGSVTDLFFGVVDGGGLAGVHVINTHDGTYSSQSISLKTAKGGVVSATDRLTIGTLGEVAMNANSTSAALKVTQVGSGNAFEVEDQASDTTPFVIAADGRTLVGAGAAYTGVFNAAFLEVHNVGGNTAQSLQRYSADAFSPDIDFVKSRSATTGTQAVVVSGDGVGTLRFAGSDGTAFKVAAQIDAFVDGTPGTNDMPGRLVFSTTADGASSPTERMRIDSAGVVLVGTTAIANFAAGTASNANAMQPGAMLVSRGNTAARTHYEVYNPNGKIGALGADGTSLVFYTGVGDVERLRIPTGGGVVLENATAIPAGGTAGLGYKVSSTANFGVFFGSGVPTLSAAKGSLYLRSDGSTVSDRAYINTDSGTTWTALVTVA